MPIPIPDPIRGTLEIRWSSRSVYIPLCENPLTTSSLVLLGHISYHRDVTPEIESIIVGFIGAPVSPVIVIDQTSNPNNERLNITVPQAVTEMEIPLIGSYSCPDPPTNVEATAVIGWGNRDRVIRIGLIQNPENESKWAIPIKLAGNMMRIPLIQDPCKKNFIIPAGYEDPSFTQLSGPIPLDAEGLLIPQCDQMFLSFPIGDHELPGFP